MKVEIVEHGTHFFWTIEDGISLVEGYCTSLADALDAISSERPETEPVLVE